MVYVEELWNHSFQCHRRETEPPKCEHGEETDPPAPEKGQIHDRGEGIDELEDERLEDEPLVKALVRLWNL